MAKKTGPKPVEFDLGELEKLGAMQCTYREVAAWFGMSEVTIKRRLGKEGSIERETFHHGQGKGLVSLRRNQFRMAENNPGMAIFLGKNYLGQSDKQETVHSGSLDLKGILNDIDGLTRGIPADGRGDGDKKPTLQ